VCSGVCLGPPTMTNEEQVVDRFGVASHVKSERI